MAVQTRRMSLEQFEQFVELPENADRLFEYVGGEVIEVVSNQRSSAIAARLLIAVGSYVLAHDLGFVTGADGGYIVANGRFIPDVAFVSKTRQPAAVDRGYGPVPPDLAIEVLPPSNEPEDMRIKVVSYLNAGATVWVVNPDRQRIEVYIPGQIPYALDTDGVLEGVSVLPGFKLAVKDVF